MVLPGSPPTIPGFETRFAALETLTALIVVALLVPEMRREMCSLKPWAQARVL